MRTLTIREQLFVDLLPAHDWITLQAAQKAGFSYNYSKHRLPGRMLVDVALQTAIKAKRAETDKKIAMEEEDILSALVLIAKNGSEAGKLRALELLGRNKIMWKDHILTERLPDQKKLDDKEQVEAQRIANIRLRQKTG